MRRRSIIRSSALRRRGTGAPRYLLCLKGGRLLSLMVHIVNRKALLVVIPLALFLAAGCSGDPRERANEAIEEANDSIQEHNELFEQARNTYEEAREAIEAGDDPAAESGRIAEARTTLGEARDSLEEAREPLEEVQELEVEDPVREYAAALSEAMEAQVSAENREMEFYELLEEDPALEESREQAGEILSEVDEGYDEAETAYGRAQEIADSNPEVMSPETPAQ